MMEGAHVGELGQELGWVSFRAAGLEKPESMGRGKARCV